MKSDFFDIEIMNSTQFNANENDTCKVSILNYM